MSDSIEELRLALVREHMESENELRGIQPTGKSFRCRMCAFFLFEPGSEKIVCERVYFDQATMAEQLLGSD